MRKKGLVMSKNGIFTLTELGIAVFGTAYAHEIYDYPIG
jgi:hypothetical protein